MATTAESRWDALVRDEVVQEGHFLLASNRHSSLFIDARKSPQWLKDQAYEAIRARYQGVLVHAMAGVPYGADHFVDYIAPMLPSGATPDGRVRAIKLTKEVDGHIFVPSYGVEIGFGTRFIVLEDVMTSAGSIERTCQALKNVGAEVVGRFAVFNRSPIDGLAETKGINYLVRRKVEDYEPSECPQCAQGIPLEKA
ncbi:MAG: hypothetical protein WDZ44_01615 [Candidatus Spechtbacterales bacterium]